VVVPVRRRITPLIEADEAHRHDEGWTARREGLGLIELRRRTRKTKADGSALIPKKGKNSGRGARA